MGKIIEVTKTAYGKRVRVHYVCDGVSMTDQSQAKDCDVNEIWKKYKKTGDVSIMKKRMGVYDELGTFTEVGDYGDILMKINAANDAFMTLPSDHRARFLNDPERFISFLQNPENNEEAYKMGYKIRPQNAGPTPEDSAGDKPKARQSKKQPDLPLEPSDD